MEYASCWVSISRSRTPCRAGNAAALSSRARRRNMLTGYGSTAPAAVPARNPNPKGPTMEHNGCLYIAAITAAFWVGAVGLILIFI